ncbi:dna polymerase eta [Holotrichia oblita]|uniref:Dna polymerase eta n=1 Tax=Holotrichia oblita TaxID=644536 RepID=A0ACB9TWX5_HOLOL|nr:dna polymerase eta [Holotrichia oblita]
MEFEHTNRVIVLVDMDCFYCQVEEKLNPFLVGKPIAVVQYNAWKGGGIIAVNYPARDKGVTRHMRGNEAKAKCPNIVLVRYLKVHLLLQTITRYRDAGKEVAAVLQAYTPLLERASVDEAYMDITDAVNERLLNEHPITLEQLRNTHVVGCNTQDFLDSFKYEHHLESNLKLCMGGIITEEIRAAVFEKTGYKCSAGIAHNKVLAKLACGLHKPNQQTILPQDSVNSLYETLPLRKIRSLGGKFGCNLSEDLGITTMKELQQISENDLINRYDDKTGSWLYKIARGIDLEPVTVRLVSKSIGCCKKFPGRTALVCCEDVQYWVNELSNEITERLNRDLEENNRKAKHMVVGFVNEINRRDVSASRTHPLHSYDAEKIAADMLKVVNKHCLNSNGYYRIKYLGISAGKFEDCKKGYDISSYFKSGDKEANTQSVKPEYNLSYFFSKIEKHGAVNETSMDTKEALQEESNNLEESCNSNDSIYKNQNLFDDQDVKSDNLEAIYEADTVMIDFPETNDDNTKYETKIQTSFTDVLSLVNRDKDSESDSITDEILNNEDKDDNSKANTSSYFSHYFKNVESFSRNFDTSKYLDVSNNEVETSSPENDEIIGGETFGNSETFESTNNTNLILIFKIMRQHLVKLLIMTRKEKCKECNKQILKTDMTSHMDYHFALQIVRNEAHLYNNNSTSAISNPPKKTVEVKKTKRKRSEITSTKLTTFLKSNTQEVVNVPTETCPHCDKNIPNTEFASHLDYHVAKKLHLEINSLLKDNTKTAPVPKNINKTKQKPKQGKPPSVIAFSSKIRN